MGYAKCPGLFCNGVGIPASEKKGFKTGKGAINSAIGFTLAGPVGAGIGVLTGFNGKKKIAFVCSKCGKTWTQKI